MKTTITRAQLAEAAQAVKGLVSKDGLSAFSKVRLDASGCLSVTGSNGDVQVEWRTESEIKDRGTVTVPGAAFASFVGAMPEGVVEIEECAGRSPRVRMEGGGVVFKLAAGEAMDFPMMAGPKDEAKAALHIDAAIMRDAQPAKKRLGPIAYFQAAVTNVMPKRSNIRLVLDGKVIETKGLGVLLVNFSHIQFEIPVTHDADARDGEFDVVILKADNAFGLIPALIAGVRDRDGSFPDRTDSMEVHRCHEVEVFADPPLPIQYDGELPGITTPFRARVLNRAVRYILSDEGLAHFS